MAEVRSGSAASCTPTRSGNPIALSWNLGGGWFMSAGFNFTSPNGTHQTGTPNPDYWTFEPSLAFSYLGNNWVASANFFYDINTKSTGRLLRCE